MAEVLNFQDMIFTLQRFWAQQGCVVLQPYDMEVGAGTFHTATFLRAIGPEPWNAAYVQPSRRPTDGRYGDNPNRLQRYYQFQVVMKPSPPRFQELYLQSMRAIGIDPAVHDMRFVEDNWESPTLGAWGLGWEVWVNGMEISQFTYFQQAGGLECKPVMGELTYGLERIAMYSLFAQFESAEKMALQLAEAGLPLPAYEQALKASHTFNLLDARRAISVTERQRYILRVRALSKAAAVAWYQSREALGFPLCQKGETA